MAFHVVLFVFVLGLLCARIRLSERVGCLSHLAFNAEDMQTSVPLLPHALKRPTSDGTKRDPCPFHACPAPRRRVVFLIRSLPGASLVPLDRWRSGVVSGHIPCQTLS